MSSAGTIEVPLDILAGQPKSSLSGNRNAEKKTILVDGSGISTVVLGRNEIPYQPMMGNTVLETNPSNTFTVPPTVAAGDGFITDFIGLDRNAQQFGTAGVSGFDRNINVQTFVNRQTNAFGDGFVEPLINPTIPTLLEVSDNAAIASIAMPISQISNSSMNSTVKKDIAPLYSNSSENTTAPDTLRTNSDVQSSLNTKETRVIKETVLNTIETFQTPPRMSDSFPKTTSDTEGHSLTAAKEVSTQSNGTVSFTSVNVENSKVGTVSNVKDSRALNPVETIITIAPLRVNDLNQDKNLSKTVAGNVNETLRPTISSEKLEKKMPKETFALQNNSTVANLTDNLSSNFEVSKTVTANETRSIKTGELINTTETRVADVVEQKRNTSHTSDKQSMTDLISENIKIKTAKLDKPPVAKSIMSTNLGPRIQESSLKANVTVISKIESKQTVDSAGNATKHGVSMKVVNTALEGKCVKKIRMFNTNFKIHFTIRDDLSCNAV